MYVRMYECMHVQQYIEYLSLHPSSVCHVYFIMCMQTAYADLISTGDVLYIYRPILTANRDDPWLFGRVQAGSQSHAAFAYQDVLRVAPPLMADYGDILCDEDDSLSKEFQRNTSSSSGKSVTNNILRSPLKARDRKTCATVHLVLGSISCLVLVKGERHISKSPLPIPPHSILPLSTCICNHIDVTVHFKNVQQFYYFCLCCFYHAQILPLNFILPSFYVITLQPMPPFHKLWSFLMIIVLLAETTIRILRRATVSTRIYALISFVILHTPQS